LSLITDRRLADHAAFLAVAETAEKSPPLGLSPQSLQKFPSQFDVFEATQLQKRNPLLDSEVSDLQGCRYPLPLSPVQILVTVSLLVQTAETVRVRFQIPIGFRCHLYNTARLPCKCL